MSDSTQKKISRIRPPRVQITYDVENGGAVEKKELPFVVGVMADLSGKRSEDKPLPKIKDRKFIFIDRDNFSEVMSGIAPRLSFRVPNTLQKDGSLLSASLTFSEMDDFRPVQVLQQVAGLKELYEARKKLNDLLTKLDGNDELSALLGDVIAKSEKQDELRNALKASAAEEPAKD
ncbi:MAG: type VI secretion system contractile sheath small subunit [Roseomonas sp.]|nr:type VI secretion system contractile sheath small subunit [Roseomonas sp.]